MIRYKFYYIILSYFYIDKVGSVIILSHSTDHLELNCETDEHCESGYICTHGKCRLLLPCLGNEDCEHGFECITPYCEKYTFDREATSNITTQYTKIKNKDTSRTLNSSYLYNISLKECECFRTIPQDQNSIGPDTENEVYFNGSQVSGSFCSPVSEMALQSFGYFSM